MTERVQKQAGAVLLSELKAAEETQGRVWILSIKNRDGTAAMEQPQITDSERMERIFSRLEDKAWASNKLEESLLGPPGFVCREFADDLRELPPDLYQYVEEHAQLLEDAIRTGKLGR